MKRQDLEEFFTAQGPEGRALLVILGSVLLAALARFFLHRIAPRLTSKTRTDLDDKIALYLKSPVSVSILLAGVNLALLLVVDREVPGPYYGYSLAILKTIAILVWQLFLIRISKLVLAALARNHRRFQFIQPQTVPALSSAATALVVGGSVYFLLLAWSINVSAWVTSAGIIGLTVSLAAKDSLANLFAGLTILADRPYKLGDFIVLESGERGEVTQIGIRSSRLLTRDDIEIIVPNSLLANSKIINEAGGPATQHRVRVRVSVAYGSDIDQVRRVLEEVAVAEVQVEEEPEPRVRFREFGTSGLAFELLAWVSEPVLRGRVLDALNTAVYKRFAAEGIEIPYSKHDVYIHKMPSAPSSGGQGEE
jgi:MscS family membrane protein